MSGRREIQDILLKKNEEIQSLRLELKEAESYAKALEDALKLMPIESAKSSNGTEEKTIALQLPVAKLRSGSEIAKSRKVLLRVKRPLHVMEILKEMGKKESAKNRVSLAGSIAAYARRGEVFVKTGPNTFGLLELMDAYPDVLFDEKNDGN